MLGNVSELSTVVATDSTPPTGGVLSANGTAGTSTGSTSYSATGSWSVARTDFFDAEVGAYGSDHADRLELVPISRERVARFRGEIYGDEEIWVVGDTANDRSRSEYSLFLVACTVDDASKFLSSIDSDLVIAILVS